MSAYSTPGGGGTTTQSKPTAGKSKFQKLDINSLYCANRGDNSEPSLVKSQLSRKHGMQCLGKVVSARRPPANLPSLKTETGQDANANSIATAAVTATATPVTCTPQTTTTASAGVVSGSSAGAGWGSLPPPTSSHFRNEFPSLEAAAQPSHREHNHTQLRPHTEGSWTSGGLASGASAAPPQNQQTPAFRNILPTFLMKGSIGGGGGLGSLSSARETRSPPQRGGRGPPPAPRATEALTARPILCEEQISSLDEISRDVGWATEDDIDYNQKLDFSDGESSAPSTNRSKSRKAEPERTEKHEPNDEEQLWAERKQKQNNEVAAAVARARQRKEEEQRRHRELQGKDGASERERQDVRETQDVRERQDIRERPDNRERADKEKLDRDRERDNRERDRPDGRDRLDRERRDSKEKERHDHRDKERSDRDRDRDRNKDRDRNDRDYRGPGDGQGFAKNFQTNIPPRFLKQQQNRQNEEQSKGWAFPSGKPGPAQVRRQEPPAFNPPRHARRSYSRDYSDREDDYRREKDSGWRSDMHDYERPGREYDRQSSKESYKDYSDRRSDSDRKSVDSQEHKTSAAEKLSEVFDRKSAKMDSASESQAAVAPVQNAQPVQVAKRESAEREFTSWAEASRDPEEKIAQKLFKNEVEPPAKVNEDNLEIKSQQMGRQTTPPTQAHVPPHLAQPPPQRQTYSQQAQAQPASQAQHAQAPTLAQSQPKQQTEQQYHMSSQSAPAQPAVQSHNQPKAPFQPAQLISNQQNVNRPVISNNKTEKPIDADVNKMVPEVAVSSGDGRPVLEQNAANVLKRPEEKSGQMIDQAKLSESKESIERKNSAGSGSDKKGRGYGGFAVYGRGWGSRDSRGRRSHRNSRSDNKASESDGSTDGAPQTERKERRRAPRSPRAPKKMDGDNQPRTTVGQSAEVVENHEAFAPRGQPSRRGRGGFQGAMRPPAPKRVSGYGPPNTKSPFSQASQVRPNDDNKDRSQIDDKSKSKSRNGSSAGRRDRRNRGPGHVSGEDENWETTSEHSDGGNSTRKQRSHGGNKSSGSERKGPPGGGRNAGRGGDQRNRPPPKKETTAHEIAEGLVDLKISAKKDEVIDDGFQEVRNKKNSKEGRAPSKEEPKQQSKSQGNSTGRNMSSTRNSGEKSSSATRGSASSTGKSGQFERSRSLRDNIAPRFMKQRQNKQLGLPTAFGPDTGAAPPPPTVNAWDKPIAQSLRGNVEEPAEPPEKSTQSSQRSTPSTAPAETKAIPACVLEKAGVLDGTTPPVETIIFENTNYKSTAPAPEPALKQKFQPQPSALKAEEAPPRELDARTIAFNGDARPPPRSIQELIAENGRPGTAESLGLPMSFEPAPKPEDSSDMKLDFSAFDSDLGHLTEEKTSKALGLQRAHIGVSTISPSAADLNLKIQSVKKVWEMPAVTEGANEELVQFGGVGFEEGGAEGGAPPNVCKVKPTQQLQSPPPQHYNHVGYAGGYGGLSVPSPPAVLFNSSQQLLGSSQQLQQQGGLYGAFLDQSRGQFGGFPAPYAAASGPYNYQPPPDMFQNLPNQYRMAPGGAPAFGGNSPSTVLISSSSNSLMSTTVKPSNQQIGAIGQYTNSSKGAGVGGVGGVGVGVGSAYQTAAAQQYLGYSGPTGDVTGQYTLPGLLPRPTPPTNSYYSPYQPPPAPAPPNYPLQFTQQAQSAGFSSQYLSSQLQVAAAAVQQMQQYRAPLQQTYAGPAPSRAPHPHAVHHSLKSPLDHNGLGGGSSPTPKVKPPAHSPPHHKYHQPPPQHPHNQHHQMAQASSRCGGGGGGRSAAPPPAAPRYPAPIQRPHAPAYRPAPPNNQHRYYQHHAHHQHRSNPVCVGAGNVSSERAGAGEVGEAGTAAPPPARHDAPAPEESPDMTAPPPQEIPAEAKAD